MADPEPITVSKEEYFATRLAQSFGIRNKISYDKFKKSFEIEENKLALDSFLRESGDLMHIFAIQSSSDSCSLFMEVPHPDKFKKKGIIALRLSEEGLNT